MKESNYSLYIFPNLPGLHILRPFTSVYGLELKTPLAKWSPTHCAKWSPLSMLLGFPPSRPEQSGNISLPLAILLLGQKSGVPPKKCHLPKKSKKLALYPLPIATWTHTLGSHLELVALVALEAISPWILLGGKGIPQRFRQGFWVVAPQGFILISYTSFFRRKWSVCPAPIKIKQYILAGIPLMEEIQKNVIDLCDGAIGCTPNNVVPMVFMVFSRNSGRL